MRQSSFCDLNKQARLQSLNACDTLDYLIEMGICLRELIFCGPCQTTRPYVYFDTVISDAEARLQGFGQRASMCRTFQSAAQAG